MADPYWCLRVTSIGIGVYNIIYCMIQFGVFGWQIRTVKVLQWEYENRQLPATGSIDAFQARFPGLYAIYTETPERRRINFMFVVVLICLGLSIVHLMTTAAMLYGVIKRAPPWIFPWFFTCAPLVVMCTAYAVIWWSGDVFNEQLTMSVSEFVFSLAINGVCFLVVLCYYLRITGRMSSDRPALFSIHDDSLRRDGDYYRRSHGGGKPDDRRPIIHGSQQSVHYPKPYPGGGGLAGFESTTRRTRRRSQSKGCCEPSGELPPWHEPMPAHPSYSMQRKLRRRERDRSRSPAAALRQGYKYDGPRELHNSPPVGNGTFRHRRQSGGTLASGGYVNRGWYGPSSSSWQDQQSLAASTSTLDARRSHSAMDLLEMGGRLPSAQYPTSTLDPQHRQWDLQQQKQNLPQQQQLTRQHPPLSSTQPLSPPQQPQQGLRRSTGRRSRTNSASSRQQPHRTGAGGVVAPAEIPFGSNSRKAAAAASRRKSPQRVSFKSRPRVYERTPESSLSGNNNNINGGGGSARWRTGGRMGEIHTVV